MSNRTILGGANPLDPTTTPDDSAAMWVHDPTEVPPAEKDRSWSLSNVFSWVMSKLRTEGEDYVPSIIPGHYSRNVRWRVKGYDTAENRRTLVSPDRILTEINNGGYVKDTAVELDINNASSWDDTADTDWTVAANRAGKDFYIYLCVPSSGFDPDIVLSPNATIPDGYTAANSRKVGQFHCLCEDVLTNVYPYENEGNDEDYVAAAYVNSSLSNGDTQHWMEGMITGDILPWSVQDLLHRPHDGATREGATFSPKDNRWGMIYLPSWDAATNRLVSRYGATIADGDSSPAFHASRFDQALGGVGYMSINRQEFVNMSLGSPQGVNIAGSADPNTTGGHAATNGQRIVSLIGMEDMTGVMYQWSRETTENSQSSWGEDGFDSNDKNVAGEDYSLPLRSLFGLHWGLGSLCGSRGAVSNNSALTLDSSSAGRGVAEPYGGRA